MNPSMRPRISVLVINYNYGRYLEQAVESILNQSIGTESIEILVIDDGSSDDSETRMLRYSKRLRWISKPNGGQVSAFNTGFKESRGEFIAVLEADDWWNPDKLRKSMRCLEEHPESALVQHWLLQVDAIGNPLPGYHYPPGPFQFNLNDTLGGLLPFAGTSALMFRADSLRPFLPLPEMPFGADLCLRAIAATIGPLQNIPETLGKRRLHGTNLFGESLFDDPRKLEIGLRVIRPLTNFYRQLLIRQKTAFNPHLFTKFALEETVMELFLSRYKGNLSKTWSLWLLSLRKCGWHRYTIFKALSLLPIFISPAFYLSLHRWHTISPWTVRLRKALFPFE